MKKILVVLLFAALSISGFSQVKSNGFDAPQVKDGIINQNSSSLFGFFNPNNFTMNQSYSMSYSTFGGNGLALGVYTNSMMYRFSNNFNVQLDASFMHSPYNTFGKNMQGSLNSFFISRAAVNYQPWKDVSISFQYRNVPSMFYNPYYDYSPYGSSSLINRSDFLFGR